MTIDWVILIFTRIMGFIIIYRIKQGHINPYFALFTVSRHLTKQRVSNLHCVTKSYQVLKIYINWIIHSYSLSLPYLSKQYKLCWYFCKKYTCLKGTNLNQDIRPARSSKRHYLPINTAIYLKRLESSTKRLVRTWMAQRQPYSLFCGLLSYGTWTTNEVNVKTSQEYKSGRI